MPRFYLHLHDGDGWTHDQEGIEFPNVAAASAAALADAREIIAADITAGEPVLVESFIAVDDANGQEVYRITFGGAASFG